jgi:hypothetical protein
MIIGIYCRKRCDIYDMDMYEISEDDQIPTQPPPANLNSLGGKAAQKALIDTHFS